MEAAALARRQRLKAAQQSHVQAQDLPFSLLENMKNPEISVLSVDPMINLAPELSKVQKQAAKDPAIHEHLTQVEKFFKQTDVESIDSATDTKAFNGTRTKTLEERAQELLREAQESYGIVINEDSNEQTFPSTTKKMSLFSIGGKGRTGGASLFKLNKSLVGGGECQDLKARFAERMRALEDLTNKAVQEMIVAREVDGDDDEKSFDVDEEGGSHVDGHPTAVQ